MTEKTMTPIDNLPRAALDELAAEPAIAKEVAANLDMVNDSLAEDVTELNEQRKDLESQLSAQPKALEWRRLDPSKDYGEPLLFRMPIVSNGKPAVDYWVDTVREREVEDEIGGVAGVYYDLTEDHGWELDVVEAEARCIPLSVMPPAPKGGSDGQ
jgi:hypothetical protein